MTAEQAERPWALRSTLIAVSDLDRSVAFYREVGPFEEIIREDALAVLGEVSSSAVVLILREARGTHQHRHGQQSLGLRSVSFSVGSLAELDRVEAVLRSHDIVPTRHEIVGGASVILRGRDPDNQPLVFVCYDESKEHGADYYRAIANLFYSLDI